MTSFTPGPWRTDEHGHIVCYPEGLSIGVLSKQLPEGELKANHQLIVSAPELVEALQEARTQISLLQSMRGIVDTGCGTLSIIDAALQKAGVKVETGEEAA